LSGAGLLSKGVVIAEVALSFVLLMSDDPQLCRIAADQPRLRLSHLLTFQLNGGGQPDPQQRAAFQREVSRRLSALGGVKSVTASFPLPLTGGYSPIRWGLEPALADPSKFQAADFQFVLPGYFETMHTRLLEGRTLTESDNCNPDTPGNTARKLVIIDEMLANKAFPHQSTVGKRILERAANPEAEWAEVIGVVEHQREVPWLNPAVNKFISPTAFSGTASPTDGPFERRVIRPNTRMYCAQRSPN
jgi:putative ABC transport system permease protein